MTTTTRAQLFESRFNDNDALNLSHWKCLQQGNIKVGLS